MLPITTMKCSTAAILVALLCSAPLVAMTHHTPEQISQMTDKAQKGDAKSLYEMSECYAEGDGVVQNMDKAEALLLEAAEKGYAIAQIYQAADCLSDGNDAQAKEWYKKGEAAILKEISKGNNEARTALGYYKILQKGSKEKTAGCSLLERAAQNGDDEDAVVFLAMYHLLLRDADNPDIEKAIAYAEKAISLGSREGKSILALCMLANGNASPADKEKAVSLIQEAAESGEPSAQYLLYGMYASPEVPGIVQDQEKSIYWLKKAADNNLAGAQGLYGEYLLSKGKNEAERRQGVAYLEKAAKHNDPRALSLLGAIYQIGYRVPEDPQKGLAFISKAAEAEYADAEYLMGNSYDKGVGVEVNVEKAVEWYKKAAEHGSSDALFKLAIAYCYGTGVEKNIQKAEEILQDAVSAGSSDAKYLLQAIPCIKMEESGEQYLALERMTKLFSVDKNIINARILLGVAWRTYAKLDNEEIAKEVELFNKGVKQHKTSDEIVDLEKAKELLNKFDIIKDSIVELNSVRLMLRDDELQTTPDALALVKEIAEFKETVRNERTAYVSEIVIAPFVYETKALFDAAIYWIGHDVEKFRKGIICLSKCASPKILYSASSDIREEFITQFARAKHEASDREWKDLREYTKALDNLDDNDLKGGKLWLPDK